MRLKRDDGTELDVAKFLPGEVVITHEYRTSGVYRPIKQLVLTYEEAKWVAEQLTKISSKGRNANPTNQKTKQTKT